MPGSGRSWRGALNRRNFVKSTGLGGAAVVAGCLGDDEVDPDDADDADPADDADDTDPADDDDDTEDVVRYDFIATNHQGGDPLPADANHFIHGDGSAPHWKSNRAVLWTGGQSFTTFEPASMPLDGWSYEPGVLEFTFGDDVFWWDGKLLDAHDHIQQMEFVDFLHGGDDLDAHGNIVSYSVIDDDTARYTLVDAWREEWAIEQTWASTHRHEYNTNFTTPWLEEFEDAPDLAAIEEIREEIEDIWVGPGENEEILPQTEHVPMEFRFDGSLGDMGERHWEWEVVPEKNGTKRRYADMINYTRFRQTYGEMEGIAIQEMQVAGSEVHSGLGTWGGEMPTEFPVAHTQVQRDFDGDAFQFQFDSHPSNLPGFRRAWAYLIDKTFYDEPTRSIPEIVGPFYTDDANRSFISDDVVDAFTDYGYDEHRWDDAEEEMVLWGFERNADGIWLMQEDGPDADAGEPMELTLHGRGWHDFVIDEATDMWADIEDWGIPLETNFDAIGSVDLDGELDEGMAVMVFYHGGGYPETAFGSTWGRDSLSWANPNIFAPSVIEAPEVGDTAGPGDYDPNDWREYESRAMVDRMAVTVDENRFQVMVDELAWAWNQLVPRFAFYNSQIDFIMNADYWESIDPQEHPEQTIRRPDDHGYWTGFWYYTGPEEGPMDPDEVEFEPVEDDD